MNEDIINIDKLNEVFIYKELERYKYLIDHLNENSHSWMNSTNEIAQRISNLESNMSSNIDSYMYIRDGLEILSSKIKKLEEQIELLISKNIKIQDDAKDIPKKKTKTYWLNVYRNGIKGSTSIRSFDSEEKAKNGSKEIYYLKTISFEVECDE